MSDRGGRALEVVAHDLFVEGEITFSGATPSMNEAHYATEWIISRWLDACGAHS